jgi:hypothetical protein
MIGLLDPLDDELWQTEGNCDIIMVHLGTCLLSWSPNQRV